MTILIGIALTVAVVFGIDWVTSALATPDGAPLGARPWFLCVSLIGLNVLTYAVWWSRWNVIAHTQLAFSIVAYVIPIAFLGVLTTLPTDSLQLYFDISTLGFLVALVGTFVGAWLAGMKSWTRLQERAGFSSEIVIQNISRRVKTLTVASIFAIALSFLVMGFAPALTSDPTLAKFFRGPYAAPYAHVAWLYRIGTSAITLLLPLVAVITWRRRTVLWVAVLIGSLAVMFLGLQRQPTFDGLLLAIGIGFAVRGRSMLPYFVILIGAYFAGAALYYILGDLGLGNFVANSTSNHSLLAQVASGAPDVSDQVNFLHAWIANPQYTDGRTFVGGLLPGNYKWNSSVWSLYVLNPGSQISSIDSGGLRLPAPLWGYVSFGWPGAIGVSLFYGLISGYLARIAKELTPSRSFVTSACWIVLYYASINVFAAFFRLSYLSVMQLLIVLTLLFWRTDKRKSRLIDATGINLEPLHVYDLRARKGPNGSIEASTSTVPGNIEEFLAAVPESTREGMRNVLDWWDAQAKGSVRSGDRTASLDRSRPGTANQTTSHIVFSANGTYAIQRGNILAAGIVSSCRRGEFDTFIRETFPSVVFHGKHYHLIGPGAPDLIAVQSFVEWLDSADEHTPAAELS